MVLKLLRFAKYNLNILYVNNYKRRDENNRYTMDLDIFKLCLKYVFRNDLFII